MPNEQNIIPNSERTPEERRDAEDMERLDKAERDRFATEQEEPITEPEE